MLSATRWVVGILVMALLCVAVIEYGNARMANSASTPVSILTNRYDNQRDGQNTAETQLTTANVNASSFGKLFADQVDGNIYAEPLYVPGVTINGTPHNVVYVATENDSVYAFDADKAGPALWHTSFLNAANNVTAVGQGQVGAENSTPGCDDIHPVYGITGTPVIDPSTNTIYMVANTSESGVVVYRIHALDITTGAEKFNGGQVISASVPGTNPADNFSGQVVFHATQHLQRPGLLLQGGVVYAGFGSHCDLDPWHGWLLGYQASNLSNQMYVYNTTPNIGQGPNSTQNNEGEGAIWASGTGPSTDQNGGIYVGTGNGSYDQNVSPPTDVSDSILRLGISSGS
jgi:hypothetical protein